MLILPRRVGGRNLQKMLNFPKQGPIEPMKSAAEAAPGRLQVPKRAPRGRENALESRFGEIARDLQPKMRPIKMWGNFGLKSGSFFKLENLI